MPTTSRLSLALAALSIGLSAQCLAADPLDAQQVKALLSNKTLEATNEVRNVPLLTYFAADGQGAQRVGGGAARPRAGKWRVDDKGRHCVKWEGQEETCHAIVPQGDGTYRRYDDSRHVVTIHKIHDGNPYNLQP